MAVGSRAAIDEVDATSDGDTFINNGNITTKEGSTRSININGINETTTNSGTLRVTALASGVIAGGTDSQTVALWQ